jgi:hypothetical protein
VAISENLGATALPELCISRPFSAALLPEVASSAASWDLNHNSLVGGLNYPFGCKAGIGLLETDEFDKVVNLWVTVRVLLCIIALSRP